MRIEPTDEERAALERIASQVAERLEATGAEAIIGGSFAKDTWLAGAGDIDIFARFDVGSEPELERRMRALDEAFPEAEEVMGSRRYLRLRVGSVEVEIIPIRPLSPTANTMDHSPDHIAYVTARLKAPDEVRRLKALLKANRIYGAESHVRGFSGYVCELLIIKYGELTQLASEAALWRPGTRVRFHEQMKDFDEPLIVEDPTDPERNAAAAVSEESLAAFTRLMGEIAAGAAFDTLLEVARVQPPYARIVMRGTHEKDDVAAAQLRKIHDRLLAEMEPFGIEEAEWEYEGGVWTSRVRLERYELEPTVEQRGPPTTMEDAARAFRRSHPDAIEKHGRLVATIEREEKRWDDVVRRVCSAPEVASFDTEEVR